MDVPRHVAFTIDSLVVYAVAVKRRVVLLWARWDGECAGRRVIDLEPVTAGPLLVHALGHHLCILYVPLAQPVDTAYKAVPAETDADGTHSESGVCAALASTVLLVYGNGWESTASVTNLIGIKSVADIVLVSSQANDLFILTTHSIVRCTMLVLGGHQRLVVQKIYSHTLDSSFLTSKSETGASHPLGMSIHINTEVDEVFVMVYSSFLYIQRLSESNLTLSYQSAADIKWCEAFKKYRRLFILKVLQLPGGKSIAQGVPSPVYHFLIVCSPGIIMYMAWGVSGTTFINLVEVPPGMRPEYTTCVQCADSFIMLNHKQQKLFCVKRVLLHSEELHSVPAFVIVKTVLEEILASSNVTFQLNAIDFSNSDVSLSILLVHGYAGIICHCIDPSPDTALYQAKPFTMTYNSFLLHSNEEHGSIYDINTSLPPNWRLLPCCIVLFSRYHTFRRVEFYPSTLFTKGVMHIFPAVVNYHSVNGRLVDKRLHLPPLPHGLLENHPETTPEEIIDRISRTSAIYGNALITIHTASEAQRFAGLVLRRWMYLRPQSELGALLAACCYMLVTDMTLGTQRWCPLPFPFPNLNFRILHTSIYESDHEGKRIPELSIVVSSTSASSRYTLLGRCLFRAGIDSPTFYHPDNMLLSITNITDVFHVQPPDSTRLVYTGLNSTYAFVTQRCRILELYHDLSDGGASYDEFGCPPQQLHSYIYKQLCTVLVHQLGGDYDRTLAPRKKPKISGENKNASTEDLRGYLTIGNNPSERIEILNRTRGARFYCVVAIVEGSITSFIQPSFSVRRPMVAGTLSEEELKWLQESQQADQEAPLTLALIIVSHVSGRAVKLYRYPVFAKLQAETTYSKEEPSIYDYFDSLIDSIQRRESRVEIVNVSTSNAPEQWILVCVCSGYIWVYRAMFGTLLALRRVSDDLGPILGIQGLAYPKGGAVYLYGQSGSQLVTLGFQHRA